MNSPTNAPRWIPAAEKPGGLEFGDIVKTATDIGVGLIVNPIANPPRVVFKHTPEIVLARAVSGLLVRQPLPESTDEAAGKLMLWDADNTEFSIGSSCPYEAAEYVADEASPDFGPFVVHLQVARRLPDRFMLVNYNHGKGEWECVSEHASQAEADASKAAIPTPTEADDAES